MTEKWCWLGDDDHTAKRSLVFIPETRLLDLSWDKSPLIKWLHTNRVRSLSLCCTYSYLIIFNDTWHHLTMNVHNPKVTWLLPQQFIFLLSRNFGDSNAGWSPWDSIRINLWRESSTKTSGNSAFSPLVRTVSRISRLDNWFTSRSCQKQFKVSSSERIYVHKIIEKHSKELGGSTHLRGGNKQILKYQFSLIPRITECCMAWLASQNTTCLLVRKSHMSEIWDATITKKIQIKRQSCRLVLYI